MIQASEAEQKSITPPPAVKETTCSGSRPDLIATSIGLARFPHPMVEAGEVLSDIFAGGQTTWGEFGSFIGITTLGNALGGIVFVALLKYGHSTRGAD